MRLDQDRSAVRTAMRGSSEKLTVARNADGETSGATYVDGPRTVHVEFDRSLRGMSGRRARVVAVRALLPGDVRGVLAGLVTRLGPPLVGAERVDGALEDGPVAWASDACGIALVAGRESLAWYEPRERARVELEIVPLAERPDLAERARQKERPAREPPPAPTRASAESASAREPAGDEAPAVDLPAPSPELREEPAPPDASAVPPRESGPESETEAPAETPGPQASERESSSSEIAIATLVPLAAEPGADPEVFHPLHTRWTPSDASAGGAGPGDIETLEQDDAEPEIVDAAVKPERDATLSVAPLLFAEADVSIRDGLTVAHSEKALGEPTARPNDDIDDRVDQTEAPPAGPAEESTTAAEAVSSAFEAPAPENDGEENAALVAVASLTPAAPVEPAPSTAARDDGAPVAVAPERPAPESPEVPISGRVTTIVVKPAPKSEGSDSRRASRAVPASPRPERIGSARDDEPRRSKRASRRRGDAYVPFNLDSSIPSRVRDAALNARASGRSASSGARARRRPVREASYGDAVSSKRPVPGGPVLGDGPRSREAAASALSEEPPVKMRHVDPVYPPGARGVSSDKRVTLELQVLASGRVGDVDVQEVTVPSVGLDAAAVDAARQWRYRPARRDGQAVESTVTVTMVFD